MRGKRPRYALLLYALSAAVLGVGLAGLFLGLPAHRGKGTPDWLALVYVIGGLIALPCAGILFMRGQRARAKLFDNVDSILKHTQRKNVPLILFLREFATDNLLPKDFDFWDMRTDEERIAAALRSFGYPVLIGRPDEVSPASTTGRIYIDHAHWKDAVKRLVDEARLIVLRMGARPGISWEIEQILAGGKTANTIFVENYRDAHSSRMVVQRLRELVAPKIVAKERSAGVVSDMWRLHEELNAVVDLMEATPLGSEIVAFVQQGERMTAITGTLEEALSKAAKALGAVEVSFTPSYIVGLLVAAFFITVPLVAVIDTIWDSPYSILVYPVVAGTLFGLVAKFRRGNIERGMRLPAPTSSG